MSSRDAPGAFFVATGILLSRVAGLVRLRAFAHYFGVPLGAAVEWIVIAYLVSVAALLLSVGRLADLVGRKTIWLTGLGLFTVASLACGAAQISRLPRAPAGARAR